MTDDLNRVTRENLTGISVVRAYNAENYQENKFENANQELTSANLFANRVMAIMSPGIQGIMSGLTLAIYWIGAILIENAAMMDKLNLFSDMVVFSTYAMQVVMAFMMLVMIFIMFPRASVSSKRIMEVLETVPIINDGTVTVAKPGIKGQIEFKNVSFKYPDAEDYVLQNITFTVAQGETVAFIGSTGCGKSTVINLVPRFYDVTEGEVLVDGINVKAYTQYALHNKIGYVSQKQFFLVELLNLMLPMVIMVEIIIFKTMSLMPFIQLKLLILLRLHHADIIAMLPKAVLITQVGKSNGFLLPGQYVVNPKL